jgi:hypothetical protein
MFKDKTRSRKFWTHKGRTVPKEILDFLFEYDTATGELFRIRENDGRHIIPPKVVRSTYFNIYDSMNTKRRFRVSDLIRIISNGT